MNTEQCDSENGNFEVAYGLYLPLDDTSLFDELHQRKADKIVDIAIRYRGVVKEYSLDEFLKLHGMKPCGAQAEDS